jgi:hypothetical protein
VAMGNIDRGQILLAGGDPVHQGVRLLDGKQSIDEDGVPLARR